MRTRIQHAPTSIIAAKPTTLPIIMAATGSATSGKRKSYTGGHVMYGV